jgi:hypothetical protein
MDEMTKMMEDAGCDGSSSLHMRSESIQNKVRIPRIPTLKNALRKKSKLLVLTELAFPFNPETGVADEKFNNDNKYRPPMSATTVALAMKDLANKNEATKAVLLKRSGVSEWDTSDSGVFTDTDWKVFAPYRVPKIFTVIATHINIPAMGTGRFGRDYAVTIARDPKTGEVVGEAPSWLKVSKFFNDKAYEQIKEYEDKIANKEITHTADQQAKYKQDVRGNCPVSDDRHINYVQMFEIPLEKNYSVNTERCVMSEANEIVKDFEVVSRYKKGIRQIIESYQEGSLSKFDKFFDFWEVDMTCPSTGDDSTMAGKAEIGRDTKFEKPTTTLKDSEYEAGGELTTMPLVQAVRNFVDKDLNVEEKVRRSMMISVYDESVESMLFNSLATVIDLHNDPYITKKVLQSNSEVISLIFGEEGDELLESVDAGITEHSEGNLDESASQKEAKEYDLTSSDFSDTEDMGDFDDVDLNVEA